MRRKFNHIALRTSLIYAFFAGIWILISDRFLESNLSPQFVSGFQTYKGWAFVIVTAFLLYCALRAQLRSLEEQTEKAAEAEEAVSKTATQLRLAVKAANIGFWDRDLRSNKVSFSPEWKRQIGYEEHEIPDQFQEWERRVHPDDLPTVLEKTNRYIADQTTHYQVEFRFQHRDGSYRWILAQASLIYDESGKPIRMLGSHVDISELKEWEVQLRKSEERLRLAADVAGLASWEIDLETREAIWSDKLFEIIGTTPEQTRPSIESWRRVVHPDDLNRMNQSLAQAEKERPATPVFSEYRVVRPADGEVIWISQAAQFFLSKEGKPTRFLGVAYDITERKKREEDLFLRNLALEHSLNGFDIVDEMAFSFMRIRPTSACGDMNRWMKSSGPLRSTIVQILQFQKSSLDNCWPKVKTPLSLWRVVKTVRPLMF